MADLPSTVEIDGVQYPVKECKNCPDPIVEITVPDGAWIPGWYHYGLSANIHGVNLAQHCPRPYAPWKAEPKEEEPDGGSVQKP